MLRQFHEYKAKHVADVASWHRSYRAQLDEARRENSRLREQIWEMQSHASTANDSLREFRHRYDADQARWNSRVEETALKQEARFWKRLAMPELDDDDPYWSADDDIIDVAEKERLAQLELRAAQEQQIASSQEGDGDGQAPLHLSQHLLQSESPVMGGVAMQRDGPAMSLPPPRPLSVVSSTGSTGP